jgi:hypothetical protein
MTGPGSLSQTALAVNRVRIASGRGSRADAQSWLDSVPLDRLGLGPEEILHVPRLGLRFPARGQGPAAAGERILRSLSTLLESAERDPPPGSPTGSACRFSSRARYLAWIAGLWLAGGAAGRSAAAAAIGPGLDYCSLEAWQRREILAEGLRLVPTVAHLARAGVAATWAASLGAPDRAEAKAAIAAPFGLDLEVPPAPAGVLPGERPGPARSGGDGRRPGAGPRPGPPASPSIARAAAILAGNRGAWRRLDEEARTILLAACALAESPSEAGRPGFADALRSAARGGDGHGAAAFDSKEEDADEARPLTRPDESRNRRRGGQSHGPDKIAEAPALQVEAAGARPGSGSARTRGPSGQSRARAAMETPGHSEGRRDRRAERFPHAPGAIHFTSRYAGLLFLLNAFVALGLYPDFTAPGGRRLAPSPLWLADAIGRARFGGRYRSDPLARWIAQRATARPLPRRWRAGDDWLDGFRDGQAPRLCHRDGRTTLWHRAGFPLADAPGHAGLQSRHRRGREAPVRSRLPRGPDARWIACLRLYLEARLRLATGDRRGLGLLAVPGEIQADELDLTAIFRLDAHPIGLRIAGLDRDLGWQPAEGRSIRFRFE